MAALVRRIFFSVLTTVAVTGVVGWARKHPNRSKEYPQQQPMARFVAAVGWLPLTGGSFMGLLFFATADVALGATISSVAILSGGVVFVLAYRNFCVAPRTYEVAFRRVLGNEQVIPCSEIAQYRVQMLQGMLSLMLKPVHGLTLNLDISTYDMTSLMRALDLHQATGEWPVPATVPGR